MQLNYNFKCTPQVSVIEAFKTKWADIVNKCKRDLTLHLVDELNSKYNTIKTEIQATYAELESITNRDQFKELKDSLTDKGAASTRLQKKMQPESRPKFKPKGKPQKGRQFNQNRQIKLTNNCNSSLKDSVNVLKLNINYLSGPSGTLICFHQSSTDHRCRHRRIMVSLE